MPSRVEKNIRFILYKSRRLSAHHKPGRLKPGSLASRSFHPTGGGDDDDDDDRAPPPFNCFKIITAKHSVRAAPEKRHVADVWRHRIMMMMMMMRQTAASSAHNLQPGKPETRRTISLRPLFPAARNNHLFPLVWVFSSFWSIMSLVY